LSEPFSLTPALSLWEREERIPLSDERRPKHFECGLTCSLSQRERAGVRENACPKQQIGGCL
jgi:hypothetical protein